MQARARSAAVLKRAFAKIAAALVAKSPREQEQAKVLLEHLARFRQQKPQRNVDARYRNREAADRALGSLKEFAHQAWTLVEPDQEIRWNWHLDELCKALEACSRRELKYLLINVPPGTMKTLLVSVFWPAWEWAGIRAWGGGPGRRYLSASYSQDQSNETNIKLRDVVESPWYREFFWTPELAKKLRLASVELRGDQNVKSRFATTAKGWRIGTSIGGVGTGLHPDVVIIDDPLTAEQARSDAERHRAWMWIKRTLAARGKARGAVFVMIMQRLHEEDPSGHVLALGGWEHICFPMRFESARADKRDNRKVEGALLWPELFDEAKVREAELLLDQYGAAGQLQQRPAPEGGGLFQRTWFPIVDAAPALAERCRGWDAAGTPGGGDFTAGVKMSKTPDGIYTIEDVVHGQWGAADVDKIMVQTAAKDGPACAQREEQEGGSAGKAVVAAHTRLLAGYDYKGVNISGDKITRAKPFRAQAEAGNVRLVRGPWNEAYLAELEVFPFGKNDDQVDGSSTAFNELTLGPKRLKQRPAIWG